MFSYLLPFRKEVLIARNEHASEECLDLQLHRQQARRSERAKRKRNAKGRIRMLQLQSNQGKRGTKSHHMR
jgi:hypothetical protein